VSCLVALCVELVAVPYYDHDGGFRFRRGLDRPIDLAAYGGERGLAGLLFHLLRFVATSRRPVFRNFASRSAIALSMICWMGMCEMFFKVVSVAWVEA